MLTNQDLQEIINSLESDRIEKTISTTNTDKFCEAICAFSNDLPSHKLPGYLIIGVNDNGNRSGLTVTDELLLNLAANRSNGNILPLPTITVQKYSFSDGDIAVIEVLPNDMPPVRYKGRVYIRVGTRKAIANEQEERILSEKRTSLSRTFDSSPCIGSKLSDLNLDIFTLSYLPEAIDKNILEENSRETHLQLASLRFYDLEKDCPTNAGLILFGNNPLYFLPGAYIQFVRFDGTDLSNEPINEKQFSGDLINLLRSLDEFVKMQINQKPVPVSTLKEDIEEDYPYLAIRELLMNAIMHRDYSTNAPIRFYWFNDRIEIQNSGGLYGNARPENFPNQNDYRNPVIAESLKVLGYVNRFSRGVIKSQELLKNNNNPSPEFIIDQPEYLLVKIFK